jgi:hypothetical protein
VPLRLVAVACLLGALACAPGTARASELVDRDAKGVRLAVNDNGEALLNYRVGGKTRRVLAWGSANAIAPTTSRAQVSFELDYSGGWGKHRRKVWEDFRDTCKPYDGPQLAWLVTACKAGDGSYWAVQSWQRMLPNYGLAASTKQAVWELRLSHWTGPLAVLEVKLDWAYKRFHHLYGRFTYLGRPVHGFRSTPSGVPLDTFGRNLYLDTRDSAYGQGWRRENSFLTHRGTGGFCYGFFPHGGRPIGSGARYRATIIGPGVTPDVTWESAALGPYDQALDAAANDEQRSLFARSSLCKPN